jgi:enoyl-CoA hydratase/3-hydroxyacyl-CoA dehydrogenase
MSVSFKAGVVGAGNMGSGIAQKMAQEGLNVVMADVSQEAADRGLEIIRRMLKQGVEKGIFTQDKVDETFARLKATADMQELRDCDLIVEAVFEDFEVKGQLLKKLDGICDVKTIFATNTSSLNVGKIASYTTRPDRVIGLHYFFHPAKNKLVEIIPHAGTSKETVDKTATIAKLHGKVAIFAADAPGFAVNRFFIPFYSEAVRILEDGVANIATIDKAARDAFQIGMGPFELMNVTGIPIAVHASTTLGNEIGPFYQTPELLKQQMESKKDFDLSEAVDESKIPAVVERLYGATLGVACEAVEQGVASLADIDRGAKLGLAWKLGPFELMNRYGIDKVYAAAKKLSVINPNFKVPKLLEDQAKTGKPFEIPVVDLEIKGDIAYITVNRPEAMNALNAEVIRQLEKQFTAAESNPDVKTIAFMGAGKAFIAGADIKFFVDNIINKNVKASIAFTETGDELFLRMENSKKLTVAVVDGLSLGGGSELALACQAIIATDAGTFGFPETGIGIYPGYGGMNRMARMIGKPLTKYYVFTGKTIKAKEAYELGIVTKMTTPAQIEDAIKELAASGAPKKYRERILPPAYKEMIEICSDENAENLITGKPVTGVIGDGSAGTITRDFAEKTAAIVAAKAPLALKTANDLMDAQEEVSLEEATQLELAKLEYMFGTADALAGLQSVGGTPPVWQGK